MSVFSLKILSAYENAYRNEYDKQVSKYLPPKIYHGGVSFDLKKRWYVYFSYRHPVTNKMTRQTPYYFDINKEKTKQDRLKKASIICGELERLLEEGYSPYEQEQESKLVNTAKSMIEYAVDIKKDCVAEKTYNDYVDKSRGFVQYLDRKGLADVPVKGLSKKHVVDFLNDKMRTTSPSTRNSYRRTLSALFTILENEEYIERNFISAIPIVSAEPKMNKAYTDSEANRVINYLKKNDPTFYLLVQFVSYNFLRPVEVCRLQVKNLNLSERTLTVQTKTKKNKTKRIPDIMIKELEQLDLSDKEAYLITADGVSRSEISAENRRHLFTKRYQKIRPLLKLSKEYTIYSFRHTFITRLYQKLRVQYGKFETYDKLMPITGHSTIAALEKYLRDIDAELPEDYSYLL